MGDWLTDAVINCAQNLLKECYPHIGGLQDTGLGETLAYAIESGEFIQIFNVRGNHWVTVSNIGCSRNHYNVYDSIRGDLSSRAKEQLCALIFSSAKEITLDFPNVQCQRGGSDCGLFSIAFTASLCTGSDPENLQYNQKCFRDHLLGCIEKRHITPFPSTMKKRSHSSHYQVVPLYCQCRQPERGRMAQCDRCSEWFHSDCVCLPININNISWFCPTCKKDMSQ